MYDQYPEYDVPQQNLVQMFFAQRWSAIVIEIALAIVISVAAGRAFDFFGPLDAPIENPPQERAAADISPDVIQADGLKRVRRGQYADKYFDIAMIYGILGYPAAAKANYEKYLELAGENANPVVQSQWSVFWAANRRIGQ